MKIGIVTFFKVANYGAMLQSYALWKYLESKGHAVVFVSHPRLAPDRPSLFRCFVSRHLNGIRIKLRIYVRFAMTSFAADYPQTHRCETIDEVRTATADCDAFIVGSDQMWNPLWCSGACLPLVMLDFAPKGKPRISYAVSFGTKEWKKEQNADVAGHLLRKFDAISVREESGVELVRELSCREDAKWMVDPTLLHTALFYKNLLDGECKIENKYILSYVLDEWVNNEDIESVLGLVKRCTGIRDVHTDKIPVKGVLSLVCKALHIQSKITVGKWLSEIANADFVVTNSFHGTVFSILFHKPFLTLPVPGKMSGMNERIVSLLSMVGLGSRIINTNDLDGCGDVVASAIDWDEVDRRLGAERLRAEVFLKGALQ